MKCAGFKIMPIFPRYEDFIEEPEQMAAKVLSWAGLQWTSASRKYILTRTTRLSLYKIITHQDHLQDYFQDHHKFILTTTSR